MGFFWVGGVFSSSIKMPSTGKEKTFCISICSNTVEQDCVEYNCEEIHSKKHQLPCRFRHGIKSSKLKAICAGQKEMDF